MKFKEQVEGVFQFTFNKQLKYYSDNSKIKKAILPDGENFHIETYELDNLPIAHVKFLNEHGILHKILEANNVVVLKNYTFRANSGKTLKIDCGGEIVFGFQMEDGVKVYKPNAEDYKVIHIGEKAKDYFFGKKQLLTKVVETKERDLPMRVQLFICAGEKDTMVLQSLGLTAVCLSSETSTYIPELVYLAMQDLDEYSQGNLEIIVVYDNDKTGITQGNKIVEKQRQYGHTIRRFEWTEEMFRDGGKDVSDCVTSGYPKEKLYERLTGKPFRSPCISSVSPVSYTGCDAKNEEEEGKTTEKYQTAKKPIAESQVEQFGKNDTSNTASFPLPAKIQIETLPETLQELINPFEKEHLEMMVLSFLTVFGAIFRNVTGKFRNDKLYTNIYTAIIGPPASGKGLIKWSQKLVNAIDQELIIESHKKLAEYEDRLEKYRQGEIKYHQVGIKPKLQTFSIPADITPAMFVWQLSDNNGFGFTFDTEMDTMVESSKGSEMLNPILRKASEGEPIVYMRKKDREHLIVPEGKLSILQSGTPKQFSRLVPDTENGLFSRFIPYVLESDLGWKDALDVDDFDYESYFSRYSDIALQYFKELERYGDPIVFELTKEQLVKFDNHFRSRLEQAKGVAGLDVRATVIRLGAITVKLAIILTTLRKLDSGESFNNSNLVVNQDLDLAFSLADITLNNVMITLKRMKNLQIEHRYGGKRLDFFYELSEEFTFAESQEIAQNLGIKSKTAENWIYNFRDEGFLAHPMKGHFNKLV
ncbi:MAG: DUF3987 domain-containing protein [Christiangramia sp.]|uniref:DUF3987 domain-containing protein n=1 Tax=Christiangramia sp. TaxID=1931228 RepID=UPI0032425440